MQGFIPLLQRQKETRQERLWRVPTSSGSSDLRGKLLSLQSMSLSQNRQSLKTLLGPEQTPCFRPQVARAASMAPAVPRCAAARTAPTATTSAAGVPAGRASWGRAASSVSLRLPFPLFSLLLRDFFFLLLVFFSSSRVSGRDVRLRLPAAVRVHEQRHVRLRDGDVLLQRGLQRDPLRPG